MLSEAKSWKMGHLVVRALAIMVMIGLSPALGFSGTYTIYPVADVSVSVTDTDNTNYLFTCDHIAYLQFDMSVIPASETITNATLMAYCDTVDGAVVDQLYAVSNNTWTESMTWADRPGYGALLATTNLTLGWDQWVIGKANVPTTGPVSFMLMHSAGDAARFYSRENPTNQPYLLVTTVGKGSNISDVYSLLFED